MRYGKISHVSAARLRVRERERKRERVSGEQGTRTVYMRQQGEGGLEGGRMRKREREREGNMF